MEVELFYFAVELVLKKFTINFGCILFGIILNCMLMLTEIVFSYLGAELKDNYRFL